MTLQPSRSLSPSLPASLAPADFEGQILGPDDPGYDAARTPVAGGVDRHPVAIYRVAGAADIARVVRLAAETGLDLAVKCGGHSAAAHGVCDGLVIDLSNLKGIEIDAEADTVWAGSGLTAGELIDALAPHRLAVPFGDTASVGIGGITLAGGAGYLVRKHGLTIDSLLEADLVTADGELVHADETSHPDLFWAIRGGGGNFGVVTRFRYRLRAVPEAFGGLLILPATPSTIAGFVAAAQAAPEELSTIFNVMPAPPAPFIPEAARGTVILMAQLLYSGGADAGGRAVAPFRGLATPLVDMLRPLAYADILGREEQGDYRPVVVMDSGFADAIDESRAAAILEAIETSDAPMRVVQIRVLGGAFARVPATATAFAHRNAKIFVQVVSLTDGSAEDRERRLDWVFRLADRLREPGPAYVAGLMDAGPERIRQAYGASTWDRLVEVKRRYDPRNLFHVNYNIPPDAE